MARQVGLRRGGPSPEHRPADPSPAKTRRSRARHRARRTDRLTSLAFALVGIVAAATLVGIVAARYVDTDLRTAVTVKGVTLSRADLRGRIALDAALVDARLAHLRTAVGAGTVAREQEQLITKAIEAGASDPLSSAIDGLIDDQLITTATSAAGLHPTVDQPAELGQASAADLGRELVWLNLDDPGKAGPAGALAPSPPDASASLGARSASRSTALAWAMSQLNAGKPLAAIAADLRTAGWTTVANDRWLADTGPVDGAPAALLMAAREPAAQRGDHLGPFLDPIHGAASIGTIGTIGTPDDPAAAATIIDAHVSGDAIARWARARAAERAMRAHLMDEWRTTPELQSRAQELVIGPADVQGRTGSFVSFAHLVVDQVPTTLVPPATDRAAQLAEVLSALPRTDREARFRALMDAASQGPGLAPLKRSGELGFFTKDELIPSLASVAFTSGVTDGSILGPVTTTAGQELFLVRARFTGSLDDRSDAALVQARSEDFGTLARRISPVNDVGRAVSGPWRSAIELVDGAAERVALFDTDLGRISDPFVLDSQLVLARPSERRIALPDSDNLARLSSGGWRSWLDGIRSKAQIIVDPEPLPGVRSGSPSPGASEPRTQDPPESAGPMTTPATPLPAGLPTFPVHP